MQKIISLCKRRGFIFPGSEIYGGLANSYDYGPLGVELKNNIKKLWWKMFVQERDDMVGLDASIIMNPKVWEVSGHVENFQDYSIECKKCNHRVRVDQYLTEEEVSYFSKTEKEAIKILNAGQREKSIQIIDDLHSYIQKIFNDRIDCPNCEKRDWAKSGQFRLLMPVFLGAMQTGKESLHYLRPETAQAMFVDFKQVQETSRKKIPFGIAQIGKAFRNEITPGNYIFRTREFEQMEIEYFIKPPKNDSDWERYFDHWLEEMKKWIKAVGIDEKKIHYHDIPKDELAHYSKRTVDIEFEFPFGQKELYGLAYRTNFDLKAHGLGYKDPETGETFIPHVIEPSLGIERTALAVLASAYAEVETRSGEEDAVHEKEIVLRLPKSLAPIKVAILPLSKKEELTKPAYQIYRDLQKYFMCQYDETASIGKRYRRQDEIGTPFCVTFDFDSVKDNAVTVRDRDTMKQERIPIDKLLGHLHKELY